MITTDELRKVPALFDLEEHELRWLIDHSEVRENQKGDLLGKGGEPIDDMVIMLEGSYLYYPSGSNEVVQFVAPLIGGVLPFSRLAHNGGDTYANSPILALFIHRSQHIPMLQAIPTLAPRLVMMLTERVRHFTRLELREEKLMSLGKLSAGLAHELNNPAAAARRAAAQFGEVIQSLEQHTLALVEQVGLDGLKKLLAQVKTLKATPLGPLEQSDLGQALSAWLESKGVQQAWEYAPTLLEAGARVDWLEQLQLPAHAWSATLGWLSAYLGTFALARDIETSTERISGIVSAVKRYTYMDQSPKQEVDVQQGLEDTLTLFSHRLKNIGLERDYDPKLPRILAFGGELNQVWTNLIDNALDAMNGSGVLRIHTAQESQNLLVEIGDSGPGIPPEIQGRVFDAFFTTKMVGKGTGLGLDTVRHIVQQHQGSVRLESQPGDTRFQVRLPLPEPQL
jgi:signal transduction histidine kinase